MTELFMEWKLEVWNLKFEVKCGDLWSRDPVYIFQFTFFFFFLVKVANPL